MHRSLRDDGLALHEKIVFADSRTVLYPLAQTYRTELLSYGTY